jgi:threonine efflux protein
LAISLLHWIVLVTPGANVLVVVNMAASGQRKAACFAAAGVTTVAGIWSALAVMGVGAVFVALPTLRTVVQCAGGLYLLYVAVRLWRSQSGSVASGSAVISPVAAFRMGFLTNILNPKSALFFGSVFATALPSNPSPELLAAAVAVVLFNALVWHLFLAFAFAAVPVQNAYARQRQKLNKIASALVGFFGVRLLVTAFHSRS